MFSPIHRIIFTFSHTPFANTFSCRMYVSMGSTGSDVNDVDSYGQIRWNHKLCRDIIETASALLGNKNLLDMFIKIAYKNTSLHNIKSVDFCVRAMETWFIAVSPHESEEKGLFFFNFLIL